jgi:hypothetical protein
MLYVFEREAHVTWLIKLLTTGLRSRRRRRHRDSMVIDAALMLSKRHGLPAAARYLSMKKVPVATALRVLSRHGLRRPLNFRNRS